MKIYTMTHKKFQPPEDTLYVPLHVGCEGKEDLGYLGDNTGENISDLNGYYGELTGVYWVWKNDQESDYIGICHYRRFFMNEQRQIMKEQEYCKLLKDCDMIVSKSMEAPGKYLDYYAEAHNAEDMYAVGRAIAKLYPEDQEVFQRVMNQNQYYYGNLMVTSRELFEEYVEWLFAILQEAGNEIDVSQYDLYNQRVFGFLSEQMVKVFIEKKKLRVCECEVGITSEKAETVEFKLAMGQLLKLGQITEARQMFYEYQKMRPDIRLELSDIRGEIPKIEQILYICQLEQEKAIDGMLSYSRNMNELISHFDRVCGLFETGWSEGIKQYIIDTRISWVMVMVLLLNLNMDLDRKQKSLEQIRTIYRELGKVDDARMLEGVEI